MMGVFLIDHTAENEPNTEQRTYMNISIFYAD